MNILWIAILTFFSMNASISVKESPIHITIHNLRNEKGYVLLSLYNTEAGFPSEASKAFKQVKTKVNGNAVEITVDQIPAGQYAISVLHDENNNGKMDTGAFGIPKEGYGASNDAKATFGPPSFKDARFEHTQDTQLKIKMRYF